MGNYIKVHYCTNKKENKTQVIDIILKYTIYMKLIKTCTFFSDSLYQIIFHFMILIFKNKIFKIKKIKKINIKLINMKL